MSSEQEKAASSVTKWRSQLVFYLNGKKTVVKNPSADLTLIEYLRDTARLTGTKLGCGEGGCGACTVTLTRPEDAGNRVAHRSVNSCLIPLCAVDGCHVTTVEGIGNNSKPHPVQERLAKLNGSQCGYCTPGFVMSLYSTLQENPKPSVHDIEDSFSGNLCRCTGYRPILDAAKTFCDGSKCATCPSRGSCGQSSKGEGDDKKAVHQDPGKPTRTIGGGEIVTTTETKLQEPLPHETFTVPFEQNPPSLPEDLKSLHQDPLHFTVYTGSDEEDDEEEERKPSYEWYRPVTMKQLLEVRASTKGKLIGGNSENRIDQKMKGIHVNKFISPAAVPELQVLTVDPKDGSLTIGGAATLTQLEHATSEALKTVNPENAEYLKAIASILPWFASPQIRNTGTVAGNIVTGCSISDLNPIFFAGDAKLTIQSLAKGERTVSIRDFFTSYRRTAITDEEVLTKITLRGSKPHEAVQMFKQTRRRDDDISLMCCCFTATISHKEEDKEANKKVESICTAFGGMDAVTRGAKSIEKKLTGMLLSAINDKLLADLVHEEFAMKKNVPGGMPAYRQTLAASFLKKFIGKCTKMANKVKGAATTENNDDTTLLSSHISVEEKQPVSRGEQVFAVDPNGGGLQTTEKAGKLHGESEQKDRGAVGEPVTHQSALLQTTGKAQFADDVRPPAGCLHAAFVFSTKPTGRIAKIDPSVALARPGVLAFFSAADLTDDQNKQGPVHQDEELFRRETVTSAGQPLGIVVAETHEAAFRAAQKDVAVTYEDSGEVPVITIEQAIKAGKFHGTQRDIRNGNLEKALKEEAEVVVEGDIRIGGQEHFYLEPNSALAIPEDQDSEITILSSTQGTQLNQKCAARACGLPLHKVVSKVKRLGGGFGGKETRTVFVSSAAALAAHRLQRPVKLTMERQHDMWSTGYRHPFYAKYKVGAKKDGTIVGADVDIFSNGGYSSDLSESVTDRSVFHIFNAYNIPNTRVKSKICLTNTVTNTAYRGFGAPQGMLVCEQFVEHVAKELKLDVTTVRTKNLMAPGNRTHYGQLVPDNTLSKLWTEILSPKRADIQTRQKTIEEFNKTHKYKKRGLSVLPTMFGINFTAKFMNQAGALVNIYQDGTVLVNHGGTEMGQGLHTKCIQIAATALGIDVDKVHIADSSTDKVPNASPTAASASSDLYGMAVLHACEQLNERLEPYWKAKCGGETKIKEKFAEVVTMAYFDRVNLSAQGFYKTPGCGFDWLAKLPDGACNSARGEPFNYFTNGCSASEVEIDTLTGDMRVLRADVIMDLGNSLNPTIDIGQIEGAYVQGLGWCMLEELVWGGGEQEWLPPGACFSKGPGVYKLPSANDVPVDMRISLLGDAPNPKAIHSSKAVGEPPFFTASSAFFAAREAIAAARKDQGNPDAFFNVDSPLSCERIRMACGDSIAEKFTQDIVSQGGKARPAGWW